MCLVWEFNSMKRAYKYITLIGIVLLVLVIAPELTLALTAGPNGPATAASLSAGDPWANPTNTFVSDGIFSTASGASSGFANGLTVTNFGFSIPSNTIIQGIQFEVQRQGTNCIGGVTIIKDGVNGSTKSDGADWPASEAFATFGNSSDLWGNTWQASDINNSSSGISIAGGPDLNSSYTCSVDYVRETVTYSILPNRALVTVTGSATTFSKGITVVN